MTDSTCRWPECDGSVLARRMCRKHYAKGHRLGNFEDPWISFAEKYAKQPCQWPDCGTISSIKGFCKSHYHKAYRLKDFDTPWLVWREPVNMRSCKWPDCGMSAASKDFCDKHYGRARILNDFDSPWANWEAHTAIVKASRPPKPDCRWPNCERQGKGRGLCASHYDRAAKVSNFDTPWVDWGEKKECSWCGSMFRRGRIDAIYCSPECSGLAFQQNNPESVKVTRNAWARRNPEKLRMKNNVRRVRQKSGVVEKFSVADIRDSKGDDCYLCGHIIDFDLRYPDPKSASLDHVFPVSRGGHHTLENAAMTHLLCNLRKGASLVVTTT